MTPSCCGSKQLSVSNCLSSILREPFKKATINSSKSVRHIGCYKLLRMCSASSDLVLQVSEERAEGERQEVSSVEREATAPEEGRQGSSKQVSQPQVACLYFVKALPQRLRAETLQASELTPHALMPHDAGGERTCKLE